MKKTEREELYNEYQNELDPNEISTPDSSNYQKYTKMKVADTVTKIVAFILAGVSFVATVKTGINLKHKKPEPTPISGDEDPDQNQESFDNVLVENFNIEGAEGILKLEDVVKDIKANGDFNDYNIKNMILFYNGYLTRDDFSLDMSDVEIFKEVQGYMTDLYSLFSDGVSEYSAAKENLLAGEESDLSYDKLQITTRAILETVSKSTDLGTRLATNYDNLLTDIRNSKVDNFEAYGNEFYSIFKEIKANKELSSYEKSVLYKFIKAIAPLHTLTKEQREEIDKELQAFDDNKVLTNAVEKLGIDFTEIVKEGETDGTFGKDITPTGEHYNKKDKEEAEKYVDKTGGKDTSKLVDKGGKPAAGNGGKHETIVESTTKTEILKEETLPSPDDKGKDETTSKEPGGKPVGTPEITKPPKEGETITEVEIVMPGEEDEPENVEDEPENVYTDEEYQDLIKKHQAGVTGMGGSIAMGAVSEVLKKRRRK